MKRQFLILLTLTGLLFGLPLMSAYAANGRGHHSGRGIGVRGSHGFGHGHGHRHRHHGLGLGFGGFFIDDGFDLAELYRELLNNVPYYALHPPVYYSYPVPRTYGYSPFAYPWYIMTPDVACAPQPLEIINPHVPSTQQAPGEAEADRAVKCEAQPEPLVIVNPFVAPSAAVAQNSR